ncbi:hypothetical protein BpHYR1_023607 [Brachionus plicatilis]|uniref:Uncharacterized protein n=1 Tax=Brachionus plicatilis TaxID=10195 RepID=A0A3M7Q082_BRAPC|nr:hypothetical protein BpHYR1_023607 [Brachionus plicatilis]
MRKIDEIKLFHSICYQTGGGIQSGFQIKIYRIPDSIVLNYVYTCSTLHYILKELKFGPIAKNIYKALFQIEFLKIFCYLLQNSLEDICNTCLKKSNCLHRIFQQVIFAALIWRLDKKAHFHALKFNFHQKLISSNADKDSMLKPQREKKGKLDIRIVQRPKIQSFFLFYLPFISRLTMAY